MINSILHLKSLFYYVVWDIPHLLPGAPHTSPPTSPSIWNLIGKLVILVAFFLLMIPLTWRQADPRKERMRAQITLLIAALVAVVLIIEIG